jgi:hypothetical protein
MAWLVRLLKIVVTAQMECKLVVICVIENSRSEAI